MACQVEGKSCVDHTTSPWPAASTNANEEMWTETSRLSVAVRVTNQTRNSKTMGRIALTKDKEITKKPTKSAQSPLSSPTSKPILISPTSSPTMPNSSSISFLLPFSSTWSTPSGLPSAQTLMRNPKKLLQRSSLRWRRAPETSKTTSVAIQTDGFQPWRVSVIVGRSVCKGIRQWWGGRRYQHIRLRRLLITFFNLSRARRWYVLPLHL